MQFVFSGKKPGGTQLHILDTLGMNAPVTIFNGVLDVPSSSCELGLFETWLDTKPEAYKCLS